MQIKVKVIVRTKKTLKCETMKLKLHLLSCSKDVLNKVRDLDAHDRSKVPTN